MMLIIKVYWNYFKGWIFLICYCKIIIWFLVCEYKYVCYDIGFFWVDKDDCVIVRCFCDLGMGNVIVDIYLYGNRINL